MGETGLGAIQPPSAALGPGSAGSSSRRNAAAPRAMPAAAPAIGGATRGGSIEGSGAGTKAVGFAVTGTTGGGTAAGATGAASETGAPTGGGGACGCSTVAGVGAADATSVSGKWHATKWPGRTSRISGSSEAQRSCAFGQRVRNRHPEGGESGEGISPPTPARAATSESGSGSGIALSSAAV